LREEYLKFDGNAQGFRLLTETTGWRRKGGLQLTCAVLGAFSKYPWTVGQGDKAKYGVMGSSVDLARYAFDRCGLITCAEDAEDVIRYARHPLVYIVEAADDISYLTADLEDAVKAKVVPSNKEAFGFLDDIAKSAISDRHERKNLMRRADQISEGDRAAKLRYLKDHAQRALKITAADTFYDNYERIIQGQMVGDLLDNSPAKDRRTAIQDFFKNEVYDDVGKVRNEIFGVTVIEGLLGFFFDALTSAKEYSNAYSVPLEIIQKRLNIFPLDNYFGSDALEQDQIINTVGSLSEDDIAKMVVDYISGMTDTYATDIFQQIYGLQRPSSTW
jgi:dGTPase